MLETPRTSWDIQKRRSYLSIWGVAMGCVHFGRLTDFPVCSETVASQAIHGMCLWVDGTNPAQVQISLDNKVKWSSHFLFLFINRLKITWDRRVYLWSDLDLAFINKITSLRKWMINDYKSSAQNRVAPKFTIMVISIHLYLCVIYTVYYPIKLS